MWRWTYEASNGKTIAVSSESYSNKSDCQRGIDIMKASDTSPMWMPTADLRAA
ncbi:YegP family protein [Sphingobium tyrosinilyticum]|uniref:YegP family protein n=1 Tax=Sphingobium tyrosinilyticum TaxID=2715436 RepID=A0ABV9EYB6_9SPHN